MIVRLAAAERIRRRLHDELKARGISQRDLADLLSRGTEEVWSQSRVGKVLNGYVELKVDDVDAICQVLGLHVSEVVRDRGLEFYAEMTPLEVRMLERLRQRPDHLDAILTLLGVRPAGAPPMKHNEPFPPRRRPGRPKNSERTASISQ